MRREKKFDTELAKWVYVVIAAPLLGALGGWARAALADRARRKRRIERYIAFLSGLPPEAKAVLVEFYMERTHTMRLDPGEPIIRYLIDRKVLQLGPGGGSYDAIDRYLTVAPELWHEMKHWAAVDIDVIAEINARLQESAEPAHQDAPRDD